jgi:prepilin-type N-terminal cleavage/methylation domain-containing protein
VKGFTLFELLLTIGIGLILSLASAPAWHHLIAQNQKATIVHQIISAIHAARSEAIAHNAVVAFCGSRDGNSCDGQWQAGQLAQLDQNQQVLRVFPGVPAGDHFWWQSSLGYNSYLKLTPTGFTQGQRGSFYYCPRYQPARYGAKIIVSDSARIRVETNSEELQQVCTQN